jgi:hypothetical protein
VQPAGGLSKGKPRPEVMEVLLEKYGEKNPEVNVMPQGRTEDMQ